jgi:hypothetical protein
MDGERRTKISHQIVSDEELEPKKIHEEVMTTLGADAYGRSQTKSDSRSL